VLLATSPAYRHQAFRVGEAAYGVQFHLEVSAELAREWAEVPEYAESLERTLGPGALSSLIADLERQGDVLLSAGREAFGRWLDLAERASSGLSRPTTTSSRGKEFR
jgi:hypothetical protein